MIKDGDFMLIYQLSVIISHLSDLLETVILVFTIYLQALEDKMYFIVLVRSGKPSVEHIDCKSW